MDVSSYFQATGKHICGYFELSVSQGYLPENDISTQAIFVTKTIFPAIFQPSHIYI